MKKQSSYRFQRSVTHLFVMDEKGDVLFMVPKATQRDGSGEIRSDRRMTEIAETIIDGLNLREKGEL